MTTAVVRPLADPGQVPSVPRQVVRATVGTVAVALVLGLSVGAWATWGTAASGRVFRVVGDPRVGLATGVTLSAGPRTVALPVLAAVTWTTATEPAAIARGTGAPVRRLDAAALVRLDRVRYGNGSAQESIAAGRRYYATPLGVVQVVTPAPDPGSASEQMAMLRPAPEVRRLPVAAQEALVRRLVAAWGVGDGAEALGAHIVVTERADGPRTLDARLWLPGTDAPCGSCAGGWGWLDKDGSLMEVSVSLEKVVGTHPVQVASAASAFDALRHHADGSVLSADGLSTQPPPGPVTAASLAIVGDPSGSSMPMTSVLVWAFADAAGNEVGEVVAEPAAG